MSAIEILTTAKQLLARQLALAVGDYLNSESNLCTKGALRKATTNSAALVGRHPRRGEYLEAYGFLLDALNIPEKYRPFDLDLEDVEVATWNDKPARTVEEAMDLLDAALVLARASVDR